MVFVTLGMGTAADLLSPHPTKVCFYVGPWFVTGGS